MCTITLLSISSATTSVQERTTSSIARRIRRATVVDLFICLEMFRPSPLCEYRRIGSFACSGVTCIVTPASVVPATESRDIVRYLRNLSISLLEGSRISDLREFSKFRDFSENRAVLFPSALVTPTLPPRLVHVHRLVSSLCPSSFPSAVRLHVGPCGGIGVSTFELRSRIAF
jgi:hypothetical protein